MSREREDLERMIPEMRELYRRTQELRRATTVPAIAKALELAAMHLHHALWDAGADVDLNPDRDA